MKKQPKLLAMLLLVAFALALYVAGCTEEQKKQIEQDRQIVLELRAATTQSVAEIQDAIKALPPNDPARRLAETKLVELDKQIKVADGVLAKLDKAAASLAAGDTTSAIVQLINAVPVPGQYAGFAALAGTIAGVIANQIKKKNQANAAADVAHGALHEVVQSVETAFPHKTDEQKLKLASAQSTSTQDLVSAIKGDPVV